MNTRARRQCGGGCRGKSEEGMEEEQRKFSAAEPWCSSSSGSSSAPAPASSLWNINMTRNIISRDSRRTGNTKYYPARARPPSTGEGISACAARTISTRRGEHVAKTTLIYGKILERLLVWFFFPFSFIVSIVAGDAVGDKLGRWQEDRVADCVGGVWLDGDWGFSWRIQLMDTCLFISDSANFFSIIKFNTVFWFNYFRAGNKS